jgi:predicted Fe-Mo cluster-binding NifX family protein
LPFHVRVGIWKIKWTRALDEPNTVSGNCGPKAFAILNAAKIDIYVGGAGTVREIIRQLKDGSLAKADSPNVDGHWA